MNEEKALKVIEVSPTLPTVDVEKALEAWRKYQELCTKLLDDNDVVVIRGTKHRKRSAWAKLRRAYGINTAVTQCQYWVTDDDWGFDIEVEASHPSGRHEVGDGSCGFKECYEDYLKALEREKNPQFPTRHIVRSKALTRAKNRATADIIGVGEISAEEVGNEAPKRKGGPKLTPRGKALAWFKRQCQDATVTGEDVYRCLGKPFDQLLNEELEKDPNADPMNIADWAWNLVIEHPE